MKIKEIFWHPIKGFSPQRLTSSNLVKGLGIPGDREFAFYFSKPDSEIDENLTAQWLSKANLVCQNDWPSLAKLQLTFDPLNKSLQFDLNEQNFFSGSYECDDDRRRISSELENYLAASTPAPGARHPNVGPLTLLGGPGRGQRFPDRANYDVSLVSLTSLDALSKEVGEPIDIRNFRGNLVLEDLEPWEEQQLIGKKIQIGATVLEIKAPIARCFNINVNAVHGKVNTNILTTLAKVQRGKFGVLANIIQSGAISVGDVCTIVSD